MNIAIKLALINSQFIKKLAQPIFVQKIENLQERREDVKNNSLLVLFFVFVFCITTLAHVEGDDGIG